MWAWNTVPINGMYTLRAMERTFLWQLETAFCVGEWGHNPFYPGFGFPNYLFSNAVHDCHRCQTLYGQMMREDQDPWSFLIHASGPLIPRGLLLHCSSWRWGWEVFAYFWKKSRNQSGKAAPLFKSKKEAAVKEVGWGFVIALENCPLHLQVTGSWQRRNSWILVITLALGILSQDTVHYSTLGKCVETWEVCASGSGTLGF